jgi:hypothetical protein
MKKIFGIFLMMLMVVSFTNTGFANSTHEKNSNNYNTNLNTSLNSNSNKNTNTNLNTNVNSNTAVAGALSLSNAKSNSTSDSKSESNANGNFVNDVKTDITFEDEKEFVTQGNVQFAAIPSFFGKDTQDQQFISVKTLVQYNTVWSVETAKNMMKDNQWGKSTKIVPLVGKVLEDFQSTEIICTSKKVDMRSNDVEVLAFGTVLVTNSKGISAGIFAQALIEAAKYGATHVQFLAEGTNTTLVAEGFGIGFSTTKADSVNTISTGGTGYSKGWSNYINPPWIQFEFLKVVEK